MSSEKELYKNQINVFVISKNPHKTEQISQTFAQVFRKLLLTNNIKTYEEFTLKFPVISIERLYSIMLDEQKPTSEECVIIAKCFNTNPTIFAEYNGDNKMESINLIDEILDKVNEIDEDLFNN